MLVRLFGRNFRSLKDPFELSMVAADLTREEDRNRGIIEVEISGATEPLRLLRSVAIFGSNASGKSTLLTAAQALHWLAIMSSQEAKPDQNIAPYEPFLLDGQTRKEPITLGCDVIHDNSLLRYELQYSQKKILSETLSILDNIGETKLVDRQLSGEVSGDLIARSDANRLYVTEMQPNVTVLSKLAQHGPRQGHESIYPFYKAIREAIEYRDYSDSVGMQLRLGASSSDEKFASDPEYQAWIMHHLIRSADVGICDVHTSRERLELPDFVKDAFAKEIDGFKLPEERVVVTFIHQGDSNASIDFSNESAGTKKLFNLSHDWWRLGNGPLTLFADELGASLHPRLLVGLIRAINHTPPAQINSQLIFTTHETSLLESQDGEPPALRRDQVYFTKKGTNGASELYSLAEYKDSARPVHNIRKRYLSGLYGAIPSVENLSL